jgi:hypothetical protein
MLRDVSQALGANRDARFGEEFDENFKVPWPRGQVVWSITFNHIQTTVALIKYDGYETDRIIMVI